MNRWTINRLTILLILSCQTLFAQSEQVEYAKPKIAIIIDDLGNQYTYGEQIINQSLVQTVAVMPQRTYTFELSKLAYTTNKDVIVHMPMDNNGRFPMGKLGLSVDYDKNETFATLEMAFAENPYATGLNNHTGSFYTEHAKNMSWVIEYLKRNNKFFIDSRTSSKSQGVIQSKKQKLAWAGRHVFLDNKKDFDSLMTQWNQALKIANNNQEVIIIGHPYPETIAFLKQLNKTELMLQFEFVKASELLNRI
ncbi:MAG: divergent polysaccharide deacetylase family protein [Saccharospirillaceae bacterium]|nr:divergent polysaccharide deacetylase family protein [Pseudomonadales bacterium]NRB79368.1 divergent polysaccharide deacetylase family protein [Saccharospirillaceae bacterium]